MPKSVTPRFKLIMRYDINDGMQDSYYRFVVGEFVPTLQNAGLYMLQAYHTAYGEQPERQVEFVTEDMETMHKVLKSDTWRQQKEKLDRYIHNYSQKVVHFRDAFQL